jgi:hypothetical protein
MELSAVHQSRGTMLSILEAQHSHLADSDERRKCLPSQDLLGPYVLPAYTFLSLAAPGISHRSLRYLSMVDLPIIVSTATESFSVESATVWIVLVLLVFFLTFFTVLTSRVSSTTEFEETIEKEHAQ